MLFGLVFRFEGIAKIGFPWNIDISDIKICITYILSGTSCFYVYGQIDKPEKEIPFLGPRKGT